jgi:hypothetical protein
LIKRNLRHPPDDIGATRFENLFPSLGDEDRRKVMMMDVDDPSRLPCALTRGAALTGRRQCERPTDPQRRTSRNQFAFHAGYLFQTL